MSTYIEGSAAQVQQHEEVAQWNEEGEEESVMRFRCSGMVPLSWVEVWKGVVGCCWGPWMSDHSLLNWGWMASPA